MLKSLGFGVDSMGDAHPPLRISLPSSGATPDGAVYVGSGKVDEPRSRPVWSEGWDLAVHADRKAAAAAYSEHHGARAGMVEQLIDLEGWKLVCTCPLGAPVPCRCAHLAFRQAQGCHNQRQAGFAAI